MPLDFRYTAALPFNRPDLGRGHAVNLEAEPGIRAFIECDPCGPYTQNLGDQRCQIGKVSSLGAREDSLQGSSLLVITTLVQIQSDLPLTVFHVARRVYKQRRVQTIERRFTVTAPLNVPSDDNRAPPF